MTTNTNQPLVLNAFKFAIKNIGGKLYRVNNILNMKQSDVNVNDKIENEIGNTNLKKFNLVTNLNKKLSQVFSDDDATSEEEFSNNVSFIEDDSDRSVSLNLDDVEDFNAIDIDSLMTFGPSTFESKGADKALTDMRSRQKFKWTHFLSIPFHENVEFVEKYEYFKKKITEENFADIDENLFQRKSRLHLTVCLFRFENIKKVETVNKLFKEAEDSIRKILDGTPLYLDFDQLEIMGTHNKTRVLYTRPNLTNSEKLRDVIDVLLNKFIENEIITEEMRESSFIFFNDISGRYENQKLHVTLLNSTFLMRQKLKPKGELNKIKAIQQDSNQSSNSYFNGMKIIKRMKNFSFGIHKVEELHLNEMRIDNESDSYKLIKRFELTTQK